jgi:hypothetical protein
VDVTGKHRGSPHIPVAAGLETIGVMALIAVVSAAFLGLPAVGVYAAIAYPSADPFILIGSLGLVFISAAGCFASSVHRKRPRSLVGRADLIERLAIAGIVAICLVNVIGEQLKWPNGAFHTAAIAIAGAAVVAMPVYWLGGRRRLMAVLAARAATRNHG